MKIRQLHAIVFSPSGFDNGICELNSWIKFGICKDLFMSISQNEIVSLRSNYL